MAELSMFFLGAGTGAFFATLSLMLSSLKDAKEYPLGALLPAGLMVFDLGGVSPFAQAGILVIGGMLGYHLLLLFWEGRPQALKHTQAQSVSHSTSHSALEDSATSAAPQILSSNLNDYL